MLENWSVGKVEEWNDGIMKSFSPHLSNIPFFQTAIVYTL